MKKLRTLVRPSRLRMEPLEDRTVPSTVFALGAGNTLFRFDSATPASVSSVGTVSNLGANETLVGIDFRPRTGQLIGVTVTTGSANNSILNTYAINAATAKATLIGSTATALPGAGDVAFGFDFNPTVDRIRVVNTNDENARLNPNNGTLAGDDTDLTPAATSDIIASAYDRNFDRQNVAGNNVIPTTLYGINRFDSTLVLQGGLDGNPPSPNGGVIAPVGSLGIALNTTADGGFDIMSVGGKANVAFAALADDTDDLVRLYSIDLATGAATAVGLIGDGTTAVRGIAILPDRVLVTGAGPGGGPHVRIIDSISGGQLASFFAFDAAFRGGVRVASGDITGDGIAEVIVAAGPGGGPHVRVFDRTGAPVAGFLGSFFAFDTSFRGGVNVASGDVNGDGFDDIIVAPDKGGGPHVRVFDGATGGVTGAEIRGFFAYDETFRGGVTVATGDLTGDGLADIITGAGFGGGPHVKAFSGADNALLFSFFAYGDAFRGGVFVATGDINGDGRDDIITGAGAGGGPHVKAFSGSDLAVLQSFFAFPATFGGGVRVAAADRDGDGREDIVAGNGNTTTTVTIFDGVSLTQLSSFFAYSGFTGGVYVGGGRQ